MEYALSSGNLYRRTELKRHGFQPDPGFFPLLRDEIDVTPAKLPDYSPAFESELKIEKLNSAITLGINDDGHLGPGWHGPETGMGNPSVGVLPMGFYFCVVLLRSAQNLHIELISKFPIQGNLLADDKFVRRFEADANTWTAVQTQISSEKPVIKITLNPTHPFCPSDFTSSADTRILGYASPPGKHPMIVCLLVLKSLFVIDH